MEDATRGVPMTTVSQLHVRPCATTDAITPYVPGRPIEEVCRDYGLVNVVTLASNENPFGPSPRALAAIIAALPDIGRYPDGGSLNLRDGLARKFGLTRDNIVTGNGSDELIMVLALAYVEPGTEAVLVTPPYSIHRTAVLATGGIPVAIPLHKYTHDVEAMVAAVTERTRIIFVANPHNPTDTIIGMDALCYLVESVPPHMLVLVDEAYHDFVDDSVRHTARELLDRHPNVVTLRTFSKAYGLAGLRAGYVLAHHDVVGVLNRVRPPFGLNRLAQVAARATLEDEAHVAHVVQETRVGRERLLTIARRQGLEAIPSQANFVLMRVDDVTAMVAALLRCGVIVRPGENLGMPGWIRVSVGREDEIDRFEDALDAVLGGRAQSSKR